MRIAFGLLLLLAVCGCAGSGSTTGAAGVERFVGNYEGGFASAQSPEISDDLNACDPEAMECPEEHRPLADIILRLGESKNGTLTAAFYQYPTDREPMDVLGRGCGTRIGELQSLERNTTQPDQQYTARFALIIENRLCAGRLRPTSTHHMLVNLYETASGERSLEVLVDKSVTSANYMYVKEDGVERRVRMDIDNTPENARRGSYRVCIQDDSGEYSRCVITDKELKQFFLPVPVPGGVAANYTWWYDLTPNLKRTRGLYKLEQYVGRFEAISE